MPCWQQVIEILGGTNHSTNEITLIRGPIANSIDGTSTSMTMIGGAGMFVVVASQNALDAMGGDHPEDAKRSIWPRENIVATKSGAIDRNGLAIAKLAITVVMIVAVVQIEDPPIIMASRVHVQTTVKAIEVGENMVHVTVTTLPGMMIAIIAGIIPAGSVAAIITIRLRNTIHNITCEMRSVSIRIGKVAIMTIGLPFRNLVGLGTITDGGRDHMDLAAECMLHPIILATQDRMMDSTVNLRQADHGTGTPILVGTVKVALDGMGLPVDTTRTSATISLHGV